MKIWVKRWKWYLISGASVLVVLLIFAVTVYIHMTPTLGEDANTADKIFDFLDKWASAGAPAIMLIAIAVALGVGIASIRHTKDIQGKQYRQGLLNEIIEWATKVINWRSENRTIFREMASIEDTKLSQRLMHAAIAEVQAFFSSITGLNKYISKVSLTFQQGLPEDIQRLITDLKAFTDFHEEWRERLFTEIDKGMGNIDIMVRIDVTEDAKQADKLARQIGESASIVLEKVAYIKGKEIGRG